MQLVSVIIPAYNPQHYLLECIASVYAQTYANIEIILVNDGSRTEFTPLFDELQKRYPQLKFLEVSPNRGVAFARNYGAAQASGEYLCFVDQDDLWAPEKIVLQSTHLDAHPQHGYVTSRQRYFLSQGVDAPPSWVKKEHLDVGLPGFLPGTLMARKSVFEKLGGFDVLLKAGTDDVDWFFRANNAGIATCELPQQLLLKRIHQKNLSSQTQAHNKELLSVVKANLMRRKAKKISVIIPCYNARKYILAALQSVQAQGDCIGEIIVVDDASTDGSGGYVHELGIPNLTLYTLAQNSGISAARNYGIAHAKCPYIAFLDADDIWPEGRSTALQDALEKNATPWAFGAIEHFISEDRLGQVDYVLPPVQTGYFASALLITAEFFSKVGAFNEALRVGEFIDWYDRARSIAPAPPALVASVVLKRRIHGNNTSILAGSQNAQDYLKVARAAILRRKKLP